MKHTVNVLASLLAGNYKVTEYYWAQANFIALGLKSEEALDLTVILVTAGLIDPDQLDIKEDTLMDLADHALYYYCTVGVTESKHIKHLHIKAKSYLPLQNFVCEMEVAIHSGDFKPWTRPPCEQAGQQEV